MNKINKFIFTMIFIISILVISGCSISDKGQTNSTMVTYKMKNGEEVKVPKNPKRIVVLGRYTGDILKFKGNIVGVDQYSKNNPLFKDKLKNVPVISEEDVEGIAKLKPDLIIGLSTAKNIDKISKVAPTVLYNYGEYSYLDQPVEIAKLLGKVKEGLSWKKQFKEKMAQSSLEIKEHIGQKVSITILENFNKNLTLIGKNFGRGSEILYDGMNFTIPKKAQELTKKTGYANISTEILPEVVGDYLVISKLPKETPSFMNSHLYKSLSSDKAKHVIEVDSSIFNFNDAMTLEYQLKFYKDKLLSMPND